MIKWIYISILYKTSSFTLWHQHSQSSVAITENKILSFMPSLQHSYALFILNCMLDYKIKMKSNGRVVKDTFKTCFKVR